MHSILGNHKTMTHQYTVDVQRGYTCIQGINSLYTTAIVFITRKRLTIKILSLTFYLGSTCISVIDTHSCNRGSNPGQGHYL